MIECEMASMDETCNESDQPPPRSNPGKKKTGAFTGQCSSDMFTSDAMCATSLFAFSSRRFEPKGEGKEGDENADG